MSGHEERFEQLLPSYALGALDGAELVRLERHLEEGCERCDAELRHLALDVESLAKGVRARKPSEHTTARIMTEIAQRPNGAKGATVANVHLPRLAAAVAVVAVIWAGWTHFGVRGQLEQMRGERDRATTQIARLEETLDDTRQEVEQMRLAQSIVASPGLRTVALAGLDSAPRASGHAFVNPETGEALFYAYNLSPPAEGRTYQLWFITDGTPVSAGIFDVDDRGSGSLVVDEVAPVASIQAWAVTEEPAGGVEQPTGTMVLSS